MPKLRIAFFSAMLLAALPGMAPVPAAAQIGTPSQPETPAPPRALTAADYGQWETPQDARLSPDGSWLAVDISRVNDENELRIHRTDSDSVVVMPYASRATFSGDGRWLAYSVWYSEPELKRMRAAEEQPRSRLGLLDVAGGDTLLVTGVADFSFSDDGRYIAMRRYSTGTATGEEARGADLVIRDLRTGEDVSFGNIGGFAWHGDRSVVAMTVDAAGNAGNGVRLWDPASGAMRLLESADADYTRLRWRADADDLLVLRVIEDDQREEATHEILVWQDVHGRTRSRSFNPVDRTGLPAATRIVATRDPAFSDDGRAIFFGLKEWPADREATPGEGTDEGDGSGVEDEQDRDDGDEGDDADEADEADDAPAGVEVWHSRDVDIIPRQKVMAPMDRERSYLAVWHMDDDRFVHLGADFTEDVVRVHGDRVAIGIDGAPYDTDRMFGPEYRDIYVIDTATGERRRALERIEHFFGASPAGRYLLYLEEDDYRVYDVAADRPINLTADIATIFVDTADDHTVEQKPPYRFAGWTEDDRSVVLHDEYDAWEVRPDGSGGARLTDGRADSVVHRYNRVGWKDDQRAIDRDEPAYWNLTGRWTKRNGYAVSPRLDRRPERRIWRDAAVAYLSRADDADVFTYRVQAFDDSPDYFVARGPLGEGRQVTSTNPFQDEFEWGRAELIDYENTRGQRLQGALFYPAGYEPGKQYPMITYIYEIRSPTVHTYYVPSEEQVYNPAVWTSLGYFVFQPDIVYRPRNPGVSAVEALLPAVERVVETGMVDPDRVGLIGHSWGGYQAAFVPTQSDVFAAAVAGAPLTELTSMYLSVYWNFGMTDARIFEISQGRMEVPPWEDLESYHANSPVHQIESLDTPMLVAFGDEDGAVDWDQGIIFYNAARRAGKDLVLLVYEGENHGLSKTPNKIDYHRRINQWFGHYLKGEPAPEWMSTGVPYLRQQEGEAAPDPVSEPE